MKNVVATYTAQGSILRRFYAQLLQPRKYSWFSLLSVLTSGILHTYSCNINITLRDRYEQNKLNINRRKPYNIAMQCFINGFLFQG